MCFLLLVACPLRSTIVNPAALPLPTVAPYARPLPGAKRWGWRFCSPWKNRRCRKREQLEVKPPTAFFVQPMLPWGNAPLRLRKVEEDMGTARPHTLRPPLRTVGGFALRVGRFVLVRRRKNNLKVDIVCTMWYNIITMRCEIDMFGLSENGNIILKRV